jgi:Photosynthesis system II assembly factor YCF48
MRTTRIHDLTALILWALCISGCHRNVVTTAPQSAPQSTPEQRPAEWHSVDFAFRVLDTTSAGNSLWICGTEETIAVSHDNGSHWQIKRNTPGGPSLSHIDFANSKFGYSAGTDGLLLMTEDGGESWIAHPGLSETILQISFADSQHGLVRVPKSLLFTTDGGSHWSAVNERQHPEGVEHFPYSFSLVALDQSHMAAMMKEGPAQYNAQDFLFTQNSGKTWQLLNIPNVTLYSFIRSNGRYWAVGTEVIHKDQPGGGYAVPVALYSPDGENWTHSGNDLSACRLEMCTLCNSQGCLSSNGVIARIFSQSASVSAFSPSKNLSTKWASTDSVVCFVGGHFQCAGLEPLSQPPGSAGSPVPTASAPGALGFSNPR